MTRRLEKSYGSPESPGPAAGPFGPAIESSGDDDAHHEPAGVFIPVPSALAALWPSDGRDGEDDSPPHITALYVGDLSSEQARDLVAAVRIATRHTEPFDLEMSDYGEFENDSGQTIAHMIPRAPDGGLDWLHGSLRRAAEDVGLEVKHHPVFKAHATLAYLDAGARYEGPKPRGKWTVDGVEVWHGGERASIAFPKAKRPVVLSAAEKAEKTAADKAEARGRAWFAAAIAGLNAIDRVVWKADRLAESERQSLEAEIRNLLKKAIARAKTERGGAADGGDAIHGDNRQLAAELGRKVEALLEQSMEQDLLDDEEIDHRTLGLARGDPKSPLAAAHADSFKAARELLASIGAKQPKKGAGLQIVGDVVRDAKSNGRGVIQRETRRVVEALDRFVIGQAPVETAEAFADDFELPDRDFIASTVHHVRATARAALTWDGAADDAAAWLIAAGDGPAATVLDRYPSGEVADLLWTVKTADELDALYHDLVVNDGRPVTSWRNLGVNFGSQEMYLPIAADALPAVAALAAERRRKWNAERAGRQDELDRLKERGDGAEGKAMARGTSGGRGAAATAARGEPGQSETLAMVLAALAAKPAIQVEGATFKPEVQAVNVYPRITVQAPPIPPAPNVEVKFEPQIVVQPAQPPNVEVRPQITVQAAAAPNIEVKPPNVEVKVEPQIIVQPAPIQAAPVPIVAPREAMVIDVFRDKNGDMEALKVRPASS